MNKKLKTSTTELHSIIPVKAQILCQIGMDLIGPMTETPRGNKCIITLADHFSKWAEAMALPDKSAYGVARCNYVFCEFLEMQLVSLLCFIVLSDHLSIWST